MKKIYQTLFVVLGGLSVHTSAKAQCVNITCPPSITVQTDSGQCSAVVNFAAPIDSNTCTSSGSMTFNYTGSMQTYTVPAGVTSIRVDASGAQGGSVTTSCAATGGLGARMIGDISVTPGEVISILVGGQGNSNGADAGGGGGTFVVRVGNVPLVVAGGGGGATNNIGSCGSNRNGLDATITTSGTASANGLVAGGTGGNGGGASSGSGGGGGGFLTDGTAGTGLANNNGKSYLNGGIGGTGNNNDGGGYGGGGAGWFTGGNGGGGGGYSGGGTSGSQPYSGGGGGGSYNSGSNQVNTAGFQTGNGRVIITYNVVGPTYTTQTAGLVSGSSFPIGQTTVAFAVTDSAGSNDSCTFSVTVVDSTAPVIVCPPSDTVSNTPGTCGATVTYGSGMAFDNCGGVTTTTLSGPASGATFPEGITTVTLQATDSAGNAATCSFDVEVVVDDASTQSVSICNGDSYVIGNNSYTATGTYVDTLSNGGGCDSVVTTNLTVEPAIDVTTSAAGGTITANATGATYQWFDCDGGGVSIISGATGQSFTASQSGSYGVIVSIGNCADTSACVTLVGMGAGQMAHEARIYPNPTTGLVTVDLGQVQMSATLEVMDLSGKKLLAQHTAQASQTQLDLSDLENGVYFVRITTQAGQHTIRLVLQN